MSKEKKKIDPQIILLDLIIVMMVFVMLGVGYGLYFEISFDKEYSSGIRDASKMSYELSENNYSSFIRDNYINEYNGYNEAVSYKALADYVEALSLYKVYSAKGYDMRADEQAKIMDRARSEMGELTIFADKADEKFGIER